MVTATHGVEESKRAFVVMSVIYLATWLLYSIHLVIAWHGMSAGLRTDTSILALASFALWLQLTNERASSFILTIAFLIFGVAAHLTLICPK